MRRLTVGVTCCVLAASAAFAGERWLHLRVDNFDGDEGNVAINLPLDMVKKMLPTLEVNGLREGRIHLDEADELDGIDLRAMLQALRDAPDSEFVKVRTRDDSVRVAKERGFLLVHVDGEDGERVRLRMPMEVVEALVAEEGDTLDVDAALRALERYDGGDLVTIESADGTVRVWIDGSETGD